MSWTTRDNTPEENAALLAEAARLDAECSQRPTEDLVSAVERAWRRSMQQRRTMLRGSLL
jgi:hypothetical protein